METRGKNKHSEAFHRRSEKQRERLAVLFRPDFFDSVSSMPYMSRLAMEKWHDTENARIEHWELGSASDKLLELIEILNAKVPDRQAATRWLDLNGAAITPDTLMQLVSETRILGYADALRTNSDKKVASTSRKHKEIGYRWLQYQAGAVDGKQHSKNSVTPILAKEFFLSERRMREVYLSGIESNRDVFPDGVEAAQQELGLL